MNPVNTNINLIKTIRDLIGAPMSECKNAINAAYASLSSSASSLNESDIMDYSIDWLRKQGITAADGLIGVSYNTVNNTVLLIELNSETDFAARHPGIRIRYRKPRFRSCRR